MKIAVLGAGGVGGYFGGRWAQAGLDVTLIARGEHLEAIQRYGIRIKSPLGDLQVPVPATDAASSIGEVDVVVVATKAWQLPAALQSVEPLIGEKTVVVGLQNGIEASQIIAETVGAQRVLGGSCRIISYIDQPGVIRHAGADPTIIVGESTGGVSKRVQRLVDALGSAEGVDIYSSSNIESVIWKKFHFFASVAGVSSATQVPMGGLRSIPEVSSILRQAMDEVVAVANAAGIAMEAEITELSLAFVDKLPVEGTSSMQRDFAAGRRTELESLNGALVRLGKRLNVPVPVNEFLYAVLLPRELQAQAASE